MRNYNVLMIEDDVDDRYITDKYFLDNGYNINVEYFPSNNENIVQYLSGLGPAGMPQLILMSGRYGLDHLVQIKSHEIFRQIPVVVLTEMSHAFSITEAYRLGASSVIEKPSTHQHTQEKIQTFSKYWFSIVELPVTSPAASY
jgi:CheY-like chemotaxis protein